MEFEEYKHCIPVQIRFADIDRLNHVNNACYLSFFELGRVKYFEEILQNNIDWGKSGFVLARTEMDHLKPVYMNDEVYCYTSVIRLGNKSLTVRNSIVKKAGGGVHVCATGTGILVAMDYLSDTSIQIPELWRKLIRGYEGRNI